MRIREQPSALYSAGPSNAPALLYHAAPIHYLPSILADGALFPKSVLAQRGISPRPRAVRRDRALGLANFVHLGLRARSPLLTDKLQRGYPHAVLVFDGPSVLAVPGAALLPLSTKAWRNKAAYSLVTARDDQEALFARTQLGRKLGLEVLVPYGLSLKLVREIVFFDVRHLELTERAAAALAPELNLPMILGRYEGSVVESSHAAELNAYLECCITSREASRPPALPFD